MWGLKRRAFAKLKRIFSPCYVIYLKDVQRQANVKYRMPLLNYQHAGKRLQDISPFAFTKEDRAACPIPGCLDTVTMLLWRAYGRPTVKVRDPAFQVFVLFRTHLDFAVTPTETATWSEPPFTEYGQYLENSGDIQVRGSLCSNTQFIYRPPQVFVIDVWMNSEARSFLWDQIKWRHEVGVHFRREDSPTMHTSQNTVWFCQVGALKHNCWFCWWFRQITDTSRGDVFAPRTIQPLASSYTTRHLHSGITLLTSISTQASTSNVITILHTREVGSPGLVITLQRHNAVIWTISTTQVSPISRNAVIETPLQIVIVIVLITPWLAKQKWKWLWLWVVLSWNHHKQSMLFMVNLACTVPF
jgi:hypothetical protein